MKYVKTEEWNEPLWLRAKSIYIEAFGEYNPKPEKIIRNMFAKKMCNLHLLSEQEQTLAIALTGSVKNSPELIIDYLAVHNEYRNQGLGVKMVEYIKNDAISSNRYDRLLIEVECEEKPDNLSRILFWEKCGFKLAKEYIHHYIWVPEPYMAMQYVINNDMFAPMRGKEMFKRISIFHKESFHVN